ncbi:MAG: helix-turn-helix transcriptional regulator [Aestuariivirga sp.]|nr:helix-turn-helix transcriptional regulator [Aestuariivirga sp.]
MNGLSAATAELIASLGTTSFADRLLGLAAAAIVHDAAALILFRENAPPIVAVDRLMPAERGYLYGDYISGVYLLSPFYRLARKGPLPRTARIMDIAPTGFKASEYHRRYFSQIGVVDMIGVLIPAGKGATVFMSLSRSIGHRHFAALDVRQLENLMLVMSAAVKRHLALPDAAIGKAPKPAAALPLPPPSLASALTSRETQVMNLVLEGHSTKSLAAQLTISVETVRVHRRHIYAKLGVSSQAELFHWFLASRAL